MGVKFKCPKCKVTVDRIDDRVEISSERIQNSDDLNCDPKITTEDKIELWWCCFCGTYFRAYYKLIKIVPLEECKKIIE